MSQIQWNVRWPSTIAPQTLDPDDVAYAEAMAVKTLRVLTLNRVGLEEITVIPCNSHGRNHHSMLFGQTTPFHPILTDSGAVANCFCGGGCSCSAENGIILQGPVHGITEIKIKGEVIPKTEYYMLGSSLFREGKGWPVCSGLDFTVTYKRGYAPGIEGEIAAGVMALEYLKAVTPSAKNCRLPKSVVNISRQGVTMQLEQGMFPGGYTNIEEVDAFIYLWNPHGLNAAPRVYSPDFHTGKQIRRF